MKGDDFMKKFISLLTALLLAVMAAVPIGAAGSAKSIDGFSLTSGDGKVSLSWNGGNGGPYDVFWKRSASAAWKKAATVKKTTVNITGLRNGTSYDFKIEAKGLVSAILSVTPSANGSKTVRDVSDSAGFESAADAVANFGAGYNIGNTFDSCGTWLDPNSSVEKFETAWGNPQITQKFVKAVADAGFGAVRLPVTWGLNADSNGNIRKAWLDRVEQVVGWILDSGMYCIINIHHDTGSDGWIHATDSSYNKAAKRFGKIWEQIAERFKDYDEKLLFECMNETLNDANDWNSTTQSDFDAIRKYEQDFVDIVRKSGGNNAERNIIVSTYAASKNTNILNSFKLPDDTAEGHMILEVHNYDPQGFTWVEAPWTTTRSTWGTDQDKKDIDNFMSLLAKRAEQLGVPAIIGEFGSQDKKNDDERAEHAQYFVSAAKKQGIACFYWDDGASYIILNRKTGEAVHPKIIKALIEGAG